MIIIKISMKIPVPGQRNRFRVTAGNHTGNCSDIFLIFQGIQQQRQSFAFADNAIIRVQRIHDFFGEYGKSAAAQNNQGAGIGSYFFNEFALGIKKTFRIGGIGIVNVPYGNSDDIRRQKILWPPAAGSSSGKQRFKPFVRVHIRNPDFMPVCYGGSHIIQSQGIDRIRFG